MSIIYEKEESDANSFDSTTEDTTTGHRDCKKSSEVIFDAFFIQTCLLRPYNSEKILYEVEAKKLIGIEIVAKSKPKRIRVLNTLSCVFGGYRHVYNYNTDYIEASSERSSNARSNSSHARRLLETTDEIAQSFNSNSLIGADGQTIIHNRNFTISNNIQFEVDDPTEASISDEFLIFQ
ncbi:hypothetical protein SteCoe_29432 [Stentor coeruleus]|uniref:Uncharacterized protein n=1 Tax=Stentor coeruleus TaxID=5963 RepID=A0A1R2B5X1_9CILI|nr:hypothetical protein SteCoe_29432 [Stentor coeruleus]